MPQDELPERLELVEERLEVGKRAVERVPVGRPVEAPPPVREEDGVSREEPRRTAHGGGRAARSGRSIGSGRQERGSPRRQKGFPPCTSL